MPVEGLVVDQSPLPDRRVRRSSTMAVQVWHPPRETGQRVRLMSRPGAGHIRSSRGSSGSYPLSSVAAVSRWLLPLLSPLLVPLAHDRPVSQAVNAPTNGPTILSYLLIRSLVPCVR